MKFLHKLLAILLCLSMVFSLAACQTEPADGTTAPSTESTKPSGTNPSNPTAAKVYNEAKAALDSAPALEITVTATEVKTFADERYEQSTTQTVTLTGRGTEHFESFVTETITQGDTTFTSEEYYDGSTVYLNFEDALYCSDMTVEDYIARLLPVALLDSDLYGQIYSEGNKLAFSDASAGESWAIYETAVLENATGTATISMDGTLTSTSYTASYRYGAVGMEISVTADITVPENTDLSAKAPTDPAAYTSLKYIDAPKMTEQALAMVKDTNTAVSTASYYLYNEYGNVYMDMETSIATMGAADQLIAKLETVTEYGIDGDISTDVETVTFRDGVASDGKTTAEEIRNYYLMQLTENLLRGNQLAKAKYTYAGAMVLLELEADESYIQKIRDSVLSTILPDEGMDHKVITADVTLSIDIYTGFPVFFSFEYMGRQTINGEKYSISLDTEIDYELGSNDAYKTITGEDPPDVEPENKATPLFYHVTGANGEEMWLLGTIHIGDDRTAYLPSEIMDAFNAAEALAVEFDVLAFEEQLKTDKKLQTQISLYCTYINGTTVKDHVDKEVYDAAVDTCKAMGIYDENLMYMKAGILESYISEYYRRHLPEYYTEKGVDYRFLTLAKEQNKTILDVENGLDQMKMFATCSKALQEYLLISALTTNAAEYYDSTKELYEAWCSGDEAHIRDLLTDDLTDMPEDELALYEEYTKIMETDRNALMLQKAIEYLQSGDVIFYAVGTAHVMAEDGLVNTLRSAGYKVELVPYDG